MIKKLFQKIKCLFNHHEYIHRIIYKNDKFERIIEVKCEHCNKIYNYEAYIDNMIYSCSSLKFLREYICRILNLHFIDETIDDNKGLCLLCHSFINIEENNIIRKKLIMNMTI